MKKISSKKITYVIATIISFAIAIIIVDWLESPRDIEFAESRGNDGTTLVNKTTKFKPNQPIQFRYIIMGNGDLFQYTTEKIDLDKPKIYSTNTVQIKVEDDKAAVYETRSAPPESGEYLFKITNLKDDWVIAEGTFEVE